MFTQFYMRYMNFQKLITTFTCVTESSLVTIHVTVHKAQFCFSVLNCCFSGVIEHTVVGTRICGRNMDVFLYVLLGIALFYHWKGTLDKGYELNTFCILSKVTGMCKKS